MEYSRSMDIYAEITCSHCQARHRSRRRWQKQGLYWFYCRCCGGRVTFSLSDLRWACLPDEAAGAELKTVPAARRPPPLPPSAATKKAPSPNAARQPLVHRRATRIASRDYGWPTDIRPPAALLEIGSKAS
ncbi:MAG: hypothetical protein H6707_08395 [Deltaproteobacteria bacterium]|nr:hypothetical protein [Deltaproteobacteria bacterium]